MWMQRESDIDFVSPEPGLLFSCLCVTEGRPAFLSWLLWNYRKQTYPRRELVIVDSSDAALPATAEPDLTVVQCPPRTSIPRKRNLAVEAARGDLITWFDDDDWQHPRKLSLLAAALAPDGVCAGSKRSWFVDLHRARARPHDAQRSLIFNSVGVRRAALAGIRFDEQRARASDTAWIMALRRDARAEPTVVPHVLSWWLCHAGNVSNPVTRYTFPQRLADVAAAVGPDHWGDTEDELAALRDRLAGPA
jgi:glycosyltransferase involved in cell wall biosynthesis